MRLVGRLLSLIVLALPLSAQRPTRDTTYWVVGQMVDAKTGVPVRRGEICLSEVSTRRWNGMCDESDTSGVFRIEAQDAGPVRLFFGCSPARGQYLVEMGSTVVNPSAESAGSPRIHRVKAGRCDQRPFEVVRREWSGWYTYGFEAGAFQACGDTAEAWVDFGQVPGLSARPFPVDRSGISSIFVRWSGTRVGPSSYGHMGMAPYQLEVDSLIEARNPSFDDCGTVPVDSVAWRKEVVQEIVRGLGGRARHFRFIVVSSGTDDAIDPWTRLLIAELTAALSTPRGGGGDSLRIELTNALPLRFADVEGAPLVELGYWVFDASERAHGPPPFTCQSGVRVRLVRSGVEVTARSGESNALFSCGSMSQ